MKIKISPEFDIMKTSQIDRKLIRKKLQQLRECCCLEEFKYGHIHPLRKNLTGMYGIQLRRYSRLILVPIEYDIKKAEQERKKIQLKKYVTGVLVCFSPNHYKTIYWPYFLLAYC